MNQLINWERENRCDFEAQHLWSKDDKKNWVGGTVEFNLNSKLAVYVNDIYNYGNDEDTEKIHYYNLGGSYTLGAHRFALNYGRQRGGLICIGGVCRFVPESTGVTANIILSFLHNIFYQNLLLLTLFINYNFN